mmetsp:Transcript_91358/g.144390  ORF Transcript_91358/g.144390 Transcript_91358/m.144390 type:complete len:246 (+) Transcript_91358:1626-2363(+)
MTRTARHQDPRSEPCTLPVVLPPLGAPEMALAENHQSHMQNAMTKTARAHRLQLRHANVAVLAFGVVHVDFPGLHLWVLGDSLRRCKQTGMTLSLRSRSLALMAAMRAARAFLPVELSVALVENPQSHKRTPMTMSFRGDLLHLARHIFYPMSMPSQARRCYTLAEPMQYFLQVVPLVDLDESPQSHKQIAMTKIVRVPCCWRQLQVPNRQFHDSSALTRSWMAPRQSRELSFHTVGLWSQRWRL